MRITNPTHSVTQMLIYTFQCSRIFYSLFGLPNKLCKRWFIDFQGYCALCNLFKNPSAECTFQENSTFESTPIPIFPYEKGMYILSSMYISSLLFFTEMLKKACFKFPRGIHIFCQKSLHHFRNDCFDIIETFLVLSLSCTQLHKCKFFLIRSKQI